MNNVQDEILADEPRFRILDEQGNILMDNISIEMITAIEQIGTLLNKVLFDSIKTDLNSRLPTSYKATQAQAQAGTDNTNYMTALRVKQLADYRYLPSKQMSIKTGTINDGETITKTSGYSNYIYLVSPTMDDYVSASDSNEIFGVAYKIECTVDQSTRAVTSRAWIKIRKAGSVDTQTYKAIKANYVEIAYN